MLEYDKEQFYEYLKTKVSDSTAKLYASDMLVSLKALKKIKLYEDKDIVEILEDFISHKKAIKNYLQDEFLSALVEVGSNDSGLYDSLQSKAKHYLAMVKSSDEKVDNKTNAIFKFRWELYDESGDGVVDSGMLTETVLEYPFDCEAFTSTDDAEKREALISEAVTEGNGFLNAVAEKDFSSLFDYPSYVRLYISAIVCNGEEHDVDLDDLVIYFDEDDDMRPEWI